MTRRSALERIVRALGEPDLCEVLADFAGIARHNRGPSGQRFAVSTAGKPRAP